MVSTNEIDDFLVQFAPSWEYRDIETALETYKSAGKDEVMLADAIKEYMESLDVQGLDEIDVCYVAYDSLYQEARSDIENLTGKDICNDSPYDHINVYGNYMCTILDGKDEEFKALQELIETIREDGRTEAIKWLYEQTKR